MNDVVGLKGEADSHNPSLPMYVVATGSDGYRALFSLGELDPGFGNEPTIVAVAMNNADLADKGFARIVAPTDLRGSRGVSNLVKLEVFIAAPGATGW